MAVAPPREHQAPRREGAHAVVRRQAYPGEPRARDPEGDVVDETRPADSPGARDEHEARQLRQPEARPVEERILPVEPRPREAQAHQRHDAQRIEPASRAFSQFGLGPHDHGERRAHEDGRGARVGAEVGPRGALGRVEEKHRRHRQAGQDRRDDEQRARRPPEDDEHPEDEQRPDDVELLLDGEAPRVLEGRGRGEQLPVALVREDGPPVGDVAQGREGVPAERRELVGLGEDARVDRDGRHEGEERRKQTTRAADPERSERDAPRAAVLGEEDRRDQEPREHEEQIDAEVAALQHPTRMEEHDAQHREPAETVERGEVRDAAVGGRGAQIRVPFGLSARLRRILMFSRAPYPSRLGQLWAIHSRRATRRRYAGSAGSCLTAWVSNASIAASALDAMAASSTRSTASLSQ